MKHFKGDVFIVPNHLITIEDDNWIWNPAERSLAKAFGAKVVQVWITSPECENWNDHMYEYRVSHLPVALFAGKKEGDEVTFGSYTATWRGEPTTPEPCMVTLRLNQRDYRYSMYGAFEDVLETLKQKEKEKVS